jgi:hypothetical protein
MKTKTTLALASLILLSISPSLAARDAKDLVGNYELTGVMEMAGGLTLKPDQKYTAGFSYGAADWIEEGNWNPDGDGVVLAGSRFKARNTKEIPLFLPSGTRFVYQDGRLTATGPGGKVVFVDPNKTPSNRKKTGEAGEGRMIVKGRVIKRDAETLMVKVAKECISFSVPALSQEVLRAAQPGKSIDVEIPYSAIISGESCPD